MPDALPLTGLFGKVPAHGDFVRRGLPTSFVGPWDAWLQDGMATARERLGDRWAAQWDGAPPWRFALPAGACGPDAVAGVLLPSEDMVGRRFPITLAVLLPSGAPVPAPSWFAVLEVAALAGRAGQADADALAAAIPLPGSEPPEAMPALNWMPAETPDDATATCWVCSAATGRRRPAPRIRSRRPSLPMRRRTCSASSARTGRRPSMRRRRKTRRAGRRICPASWVRTRAARPCADAAVHAGPSSRARRWSDGGCLRRRGAGGTA
jgi:type VI secretion system protein ImpM